MTEPSTSQRMRSGMPVVASNPSAGMGVHPAGSVAAPAGAPGELLGRERQRQHAALALDARQGATAGGHDQGCVLVAMMRVDEGMALMETVMAAALGGELGARTTGRIFCNMMDICERLADYRRAGEWDDAARRWCVRTGHSSGFPGICRVRRAGIMRVRGQWSEAEQEARCASLELKDFLDFAAFRIRPSGRSKSSRSSRPEFRKYC